MDWITQEYVKEQAELGELPALKCSWLHHHQGETADWVELKEAMETDKFRLGEDHCACCQFSDKLCKDCLLGGYWCRDSKEWNNIKIALSVLKHDYSNANFKAFQEAEAEVCTYIQGVIDKKKAEQDDINCGTCKYDEAFQTGKERRPCRRCDSKKNGWQSKEAKPELRHGDYGYAKFNNRPAMSVRLQGSECMTAMKSDGVLEYLRSPLESDPDLILGNIFDDLKLYSEDLTEFEVSKDGAIFTARNTGDHILINIKGVAFKYDTATEIAHKILQEVATARKKQDKGK